MQFGEIPNMQAMRPRLINLTEAMLLTSLKKTSIYALIAAGELHSIKLGRRVAFLEEEVFAFINSRSETARAAMQARTSGEGATL